MKKLILFLFLLATYVNGLFAQLNSYLGSYTGQNKDGFLQPVASLLTTSFNTGLVQYASIDSGFHFYFGLVGSASFVFGDHLKYFNATTPIGFSPQSTVKVPTLLGPRNSVNQAGTNGLVYTFPAGAGLKFLSLVVPQITVGTIAGTECIGRFFAYDTREDAGKMDYLALGFRHDIGRYFMKESHYKISIGYTYQKADVGDYLHLTSHLIQAIVGKSGKHWNYFAFAGYQSGNIKGEYESTDAESTLIKYDLDNQSPIVAGLSGGFTMGALHIQSIIQGFDPKVMSFSLGLKF